MPKSTYRFTQTFIMGLKPNGTDYRVWDDTVANLNVRISKRGVKTFYFCYRNEDGKQRWPKIGRATAMTVDQARKIARELQTEVDQGRDPLAERQRVRDEPTMTDLWEAYFNQHALPKKKASSVKEDERLWRLHVAPRFATTKVKAISLAMLRKMHADMSETPGAANRTLALLSTMMSFAVDAEWVDNNPCPRIKRYPEEAKERFLTDAEAKRLWAALDTDRDQCAATIIKTLLLTGARKGEVLSMRWQDLCLDGPDPTWTIAVGKQKSERAKRRVFVRPLDHSVAAMLREWRSAQRTPSVTWVFPSERKRGSHRTCFKYAWNRIRQSAGLADVRVHDLRHSFASFAINSGVSLAAVGGALGHKDLRTTQRYAHLTDKSIRDAASAVSHCLRS